MIDSSANSDKELFEPEHKNIDCPKCLRKKVYLDREIGCYCMFCGHLLSADEVLIQMNKRYVITSPIIRSDKKEKPHIVEIKEIHSGKIKADHVVSESDKHKGPETR